MITKSTAYKTSDGQTVATLDEAQKQELLLILGDSALAKEPLIDVLMKNKEKVVDILTTKENSRPKARKVNGAARKPKAKPASVAA